MDKIRESNRVLTPYEFDKIYEIIPKEKFKRSWDTALHTGMRFTELWAFSQNPKLHDPKRRTIIIQSKKPKARMKQRRVHLTREFNKILVLYIKDEGLYYPDETRSWYDNVRRWAERAGIEDWHNINAKTTRKTWESWLLLSYPEKATHILLSQGHIQSTALVHYLNLSFTDEEIKEIKMRTAGWME